MKKMIFALLLALPLVGWSAPELTSISDSDMKDIAKGMGANFTHNSMMGASKLGTIFGFQLGVVAAQTSTPKLEDLGGKDFKNLYNAGLVGAVGIPFGFSFEAMVMPSYKANGNKADSRSFAVKMNINEVIPVLPVNLALRGFASNAALSFNQDILSTPAKIESDTSVTGVQLLFSPMIPVIEPYVGVGFLNAETKLKVSGNTGTIFDNASIQSDKKSVSGTQFLAGLEVNLLVIKLGAEYSQAFGNSRYGAKLAFGF